MKLKEYLKKNNLTWDAFADRASISRQTIYNIMYDKHTPTGGTLNKIIAATNGNVKAEDMLNGTR